MAIDPHSRGFGYAIMEGPLELVDFGTIETRLRKKDERICQQVERLVQVYNPHVVLLPDPKSWKRHGQTTSRLLAFVVQRYSRQPRVRMILWKEVEKAFSEARNKHQMARAVVDLLPQLARWLPPPRKPWMGEDRRVNIFDAVSLALAFFQSGRR
jgi:Holliday junction resolvasome RuvABC endonuclease subunit